MDTERLALPDGNWWEIKRQLTRGDRRAIDKAIASNWGELLSELQATKVDIMPLLAQGRDLQDGKTPEWSTEEEDATLLRGSIAWSYPEPISQDSIDSLSDDAVATVLGRMKVLYRPWSSQRMDDLKKESATPSWHQRNT